MNVLLYSARDRKAEKWSITVGRSDQNLRGPRMQPTTCAATAKRLDGCRCLSITSTRHQQLPMDVCCLRPSSAANPPHVAAAVNRWDKQMYGRTLERFNTLSEYCAEREKHIPVMMIIHWPTSLGVKLVMNCPDESAPILSVCVSPLGDRAIILTAPRRTSSSRRLSAGRPPGTCIRMLPPASPPSLHGQLSTDIATTATRCAL